jgi:pyridoxal phosphate enzyme (YggS family)
VAQLDAGRVRANLAEVREQVGPDVQVLAATKYLPLDQVGVLAEAGVTLAGENRAQDLEAKAAAHPELTWDFIGQLQSRKVKAILPHVRYVHSVASDSALKELGRHGTPETRVLVQVNIAAEDGKAGIAPGELPAFLERCPVEVVGLMTMPPAAERPEDSRRWFAALRELAAAHGLPELSMGTTQDYEVAAREGATIVRIGSRLYA